MLPFSITIAVSFPFIFFKHLSKGTNMSIIGKFVCIISFKKIFVLIFSFLLLYSSHFALKNISRASPVLLYKDKEKNSFIINQYVIYKVYTTSISYGNPVN